MDQHKAPLFEKLRSLTLTKRASFHVPGHKFGQHLHDDEHDVLKQVMSIDYTEIEGLDDLHDPKGVIAEAQQLAASCFGADHTFFLVNGSTAGNLALILSVCARNDLIIVQRDAHKSVLHGLMLVGAQAVFISPVVDQISGLSIGVSYDDVAAALRQFPEAKAVLLTNPSYYGRGIALQSIAELVHAYDIPLIVDEAHGAHYGFHPQVPQSALLSGADGVVQSTHKMLTSLTMSAMLHLRGDRIAVDTVQQSLAIVQSSSPSYPLMASLDVSRRLVATAGRELLDEGMAIVRQFELELQQLPWFQMAQDDPANDVTQDPFKIAIKDGTGTLSGFALQRAIESHGCMVELADPVYTLLSFSLSSQSEDVALLIAALNKISRDFHLEKKEIRANTSNIMTMPRFEQSKVHFDAMGCDASSKKLVSILAAVNKRSAEMVIPYPPGIPVLFPGEVITLETAEYLLRLTTLGAAFHGAARIEEGQLLVYND